MKDIELPVSQSFSITINPQNIERGEPVDIGNGFMGTRLGVLFDDKILAITEKARLNGGKVLYAATAVEQDMVSILLMYFMGPFETGSKKRELFEEEILQSSALSYNTKKHLVSTIINTHSLLKGKSKNKLQLNLKNIMDWRNAFAHGKVQHDSKHGCFVNYYSGGPKTLKLTDEFWGKLEKTFYDCSDMLKQVFNSIEKMK